MLYGYISNSYAGKLYCHVRCTPPQAEEARKIVKNAEPTIVDTIACIKAEQPFPVPRNNLYDRFMSGPVNPIFYQFFVKATAFQTDDKK